jgi:hypothetical protein
MGLDAIPAKARIIAALAGIIALSSAFADRATAQTSGLAGTWSGTGRVVLATGDTERARCRATIRKQTGRTFSISAVCATPSTRIAQTARVQQISTSGYEGRFFNREYDITGNIWITLRGNRLAATLTGGGATGTMSLGR